MIVNIKQEKSFVSTKFIFLYFCHIGDTPKNVCNLQSLDVNESRNVSNKQIISYSHDADKAFIKETLMKLWAAKKIKTTVTKCNLVFGPGLISISLLETRRNKLNPV